MIFIGIRARHAYLPRHRRGHRPPLPENAKIAPVGCNRFSSTSVETNDDEPPSYPLLTPRSPRRPSSLAMRAAGAATEKSPFSAQRAHGSRRRRRRRFSTTLVSSHRGDDTCKVAPAAQIAAGGRQSYTRQRKKKKGASTPLASPSA